MEVAERPQGFSKAVFIFYLESPMKILMEYNKLKTN